jgi:hypothetical protein
MHYASSLEKGTGRRGGGGLLEQIKTEKSMFIVHLTIYNFMVRALSTQEACIQNIDQTISHSYEEKKLTSASRLSKQKK